MFSAIRTRIRRSSLPARLTFWYVLTLGASLLLFSIFVYAVRANALYSELDAALALRGHQLLDELRPALLGLDVASDLTASGRLRNVAAIVLEAPDRLLFRSPAFPALDWAGERILGAAARETTPIVTVHDSAGAALHVLTVGVDRPAAEAQRLNERLDVQADSDELIRLVVTLNEMLDRIESSVHAARRFAGDSSHELQTPLAAMRAAVEACLAGDRPTADYRTMANEILAELTRMSMLIRDLRLLALADAGYLITSPDAVDLAALTIEGCEVARAIAEDKHINVEVAIDARPIVQGSALHLRRVLLNLTENAIKYSPPGSVVEVSVGLDHGEAIDVVRDHGCGIPAADLPHIFQPFYRADPARARDTGGSGLGLAIADQVARAHGGRIEVVSQLGDGTTFTVRLPATSR